MTKAISPIENPSLNMAMAGAIKNVDTSGVEINSTGEVFVYPVDQAAGQWKISQNSGEHAVRLTVQVEPDDTGTALTVSISAPGFVYRVEKTIRYLDEQDLKDNIANELSNFVQEYQDVCYSQIA